MIVFDVSSRPGQSSGADLQGTYWACSSKTCKESLKIPKGIRIRISKKNRHHNGQRKGQKDKQRSTYIYIYITRIQVLREGRHAMYSI